MIWLDLCTLEPILMQSHLDLRYHELFHITVLALGNSYLSPLRVAVDDGKFPGDYRGSTDRARTLSRM